jgi:hypothetical protein
MTNETDSFECFSVLEAQSADETSVRALQQWLRSCSENESDEADERCEIALRAARIVECHQIVTQSAAKLVECCEGIHHLKAHLSRQPAKSSDFLHCIRVIELASAFFEAGLSARLMAIRPSCLDFHSNHATVERALHSWYKYDLLPIEVTTEIKRRMTNSVPAS